LPIKELISVCRRHGVKIFVDGAHTPGQVDLDLQHLGADFFAGRPTYDNLYFTKQTFVDKKQTKNNNIELDSKNCHVEQLSIDTATSNREET